MKLYIDGKEVHENNIENIKNDKGVIVVSLVYHDIKERIITDSMIHDIKLRNDGEK